MTHLQLVLLSFNIVARLWRKLIVCVQTHPYLCSSEVPKDVVQVEFWASYTWAVNLWNHPPPTLNVAFGSLNFTPTSSKRHITLAWNVTRLSVPFSVFYFPSTILITFPFHVAPAHFFIIIMDFKGAETLTWSFVHSHCCGC